MSYSWVDPHFAALYARREEERLAERLVTRMRERAAHEPCLTSRVNTPDVSLRSGDWPSDVVDEIVRGPHLRLL